MYAKTITLFNHYVNGTTNEWRATVLHGVDLIVDRAVIVSRLGENSKDKGTLHIRMKDGKIQGHKVMSPKEWQLNPNDGITFKTGNNFDFILADEWKGDATISDANYTGGFYNHMNKTYDGVYSLTSATEYTLIPHMEITVS